MHLKRNSLTAVSVRATEARRHDGIMSNICVGCFWPRQASLFRIRGCDHHSSGGWQRSWRGQRLEPVTSSPFETRARANGFKDHELRLEPTPDVAPFRCMEMTRGYALPFRSRGDDSRSRRSSQ
jgi:hypothetical protein